jgi:hypothetical protein
VTWLSESNVQPFKPAQDVGGVNPGGSQDVRFGRCPRLKSTLASIFHRRLLAGCCRGVTMPS